MPTCVAPDGTGPGDTLPELPTHGMTESGRQLPTAFDESCVYEHAFLTSFEACTWNTTAEYDGAGDAHRKSAIDIIAVHRGKGLQHHTTCY